jgi:Histidine phosphatase superfamily (branch 2)
MNRQLLQQQQQQRRRLGNLSIGDSKSSRQRSWAWGPSTGARSLAAGLAMSTLLVLAVTRHSWWVVRVGTAQAAQGGPCNGIRARSYRTVAVQVVHRHGDRTPITPLINEEYWASTLIPDHELKTMEAGTLLVNDDSKDAAPGQNTHTASGRGPFGKLTQTGLQQMIQVGVKLRDVLGVSTRDHGKLFHKTLRPLSPSSIRVVSTNFPRTIQSVQGTLSGLLNQRNKDDEMIAIDIGHTDIMIPDPQPRRTSEQASLESQLVSSDYLLAKELEMLPLARRATAALSPFLAPDARGMAFGVEDTHATVSSTNEAPPLSWNQLAEVTKCLHVRGQLPDGISPEDQHLIGQHAAWRWFEILRHPRLAFLAMSPLARLQLDYFAQVVDRTNDDSPRLTIWSAHDSTLIGLLCLYRLEKPAEWPEYASYLMLELLEETCQGGGKQWWVRFSLNGQVLKSQWGQDSPDTVELMHLQKQVTAAPADTSTSINAV